MKNLYLLDNYEKCITGFTTYKQELFSCLKHYEGAITYQVILSYPTDEFFIETIDSIITFYIPEVHGDNSIYSISTLLKLYIADSPETIFIQNFSPAYTLLKQLKVFFHYARLPMLFMILCGQLSLWGMSMSLRKSYLEKSLAKIIL